MSRVQLSRLLALGVVLLGCGVSLAQPGLAVAEPDLTGAVVSAFSTSRLVRLALQLGALLILLRAGTWWSLRHGRSRGSLGYRLGNWMPTLRVVAGFAAFLLIFDALVPGHPTARPVVAILLFVAVLWAIREVFQNAAAGAVLLARRSVRVGQHLRVGDQEGRVRSVTLRGVELEAADGSRVFVPGRRMQTDVATFAPGTGRAAPVSVTCPLPTAGHLHADEVQRLCHRLVLMSPRRAPGSPALVHVDADVAHVTLTVTPFDSEEAGSLEAELTCRVRETFEPPAPPEPEPLDVL